MTEYTTDFDPDGGYYSNGMITVERPGSSLNQAFYLFNVTEHGGLELPKHRDESPPREVWSLALDVLLENVDQDVSPTYK